MRGTISIIVIAVLGFFGYQWGLNGKNPAQVFSGATEIAADVAGDAADMAGDAAATEDTADSVEETAAAVTPATEGFDISSVLSPETFDADKINEWIDGPKVGAMVSTPLKSAVNAAGDNPDMIYGVIDQIKKPLAFKARDNITIQKGPL